MTALMSTAHASDTATAALLLDRGADTEAKDSDGLTALMFAAMKGRTTTAALLLDRGANVAATHCRGVTALMFAAMSGRAATLTLLLDHGASPSATCRGSTAFDFASEKGHAATVGAALMARLDPRPEPVASAGSTAAPKDFATPPFRNTGASAGNRGTDAQKVAAAPGSSEHREVAAGFDKTLAGRFNDFTHVDGMRNPIVGLFDNAVNPAVSISEAVGRLPFAAELKAQLWTAKKWVKMMPTLTAMAAVPGMTADLAAAIWLYTCESRLYPELNAKLRSESRAELRQGFFPYLRLLITALGKLRAAQGAAKRMVNRGIPLDLVSLHPDDYCKDETMVWWALSSTTSDVSVLSNSMFLGESGNRTIVQIHTSQAVDVTAFTAIKGEAELLLPPGVALLITGVLAMGNGLTMLTCEDDPDAPQLLS